MTGTKRTKRKNPAFDPEAYRWEPDGEVGGSDAPVLALLALTGTLVVARADGTVEAVPVADGPGPLMGGPRLLGRSEPPVTALAWGFGEVLGAVGDRIVRIGAGLREGPDLGAPIGALCTRDGRVFAVAGDAVHTLDRDGDAWTVSRRTPLPFDGAHDLDVDRNGRHAVVCRRPRDGVVVELETGAQIGHLRPAQHAVKTTNEMYARFSPVADNVYRFSSREHSVDKMARLARSGRTLGFAHDLHQPSSWCTPVASSPDGRHVASRQSGVGVLVWDLATERQVLFAELDDADRQAKYARSARRTPTAARALGDGIKITRWAGLPEIDGDASAVAVAPGARYAAVGGADGTVTVVDGATRRIEAGAGRVRQPPLLTGIVPVGPTERRGFAGGAFLGVAKDGRVVSVDLATREVREHGALDLTGIVVLGSDVAVEDDVFVLKHWEGHRAYDRETLAEVWRTDDISSAYPRQFSSGGLLLGYPDEGEPPRALIRYDPRTRERGQDLPLVCEHGAFAPEDAVGVPGTQDVAVLGECFPGRRARWHLFHNGEPAVHLPPFEAVLPEIGAGITREEGTWSLRPFLAPDRPLASGLTDGGLAGIHRAMHVDLARGLALSRDATGHRLAVWRLDGSAFHLYDALGEAWSTRYAFADDGTLWFHAYKRDSLYRLILPEG
ncbi:WD40 repeat domain-containing protein [Actinocorallia aurea]